MFNFLFYFLKLKVQKNIYIFKRDFVNVSTLYKLALKYFLCREGIGLCNDLGLSVRIFIQTI